jgi:hypothetical protein
VLAKLLVERAERLVHQDQLRIEDQRAREGHALLLASRELRGASRLEPPEPHHVERLRDAPRAVRSGDPAREQRKGHVLPGRHVGEQGVVLEDDADVALVRRQIADRPGGQADVAARGHLESGQHHQRRGLPGTGRPEERQELPGADVEVEVVDDQRLAVERLVDADEPNEGFLAAPHATASRARPTRPRSRPSRSSRRRTGAT